jgi:iron complex transport system ATP-binding protein
MMLDVNKVSYTYGERKIGVWAIDNIYASFEPGHFYGIIGPNGCGKSTLLDLLCGHKFPDRGSVSYGGRLLSAYGKKTLARNIALVPQALPLNFPYTAREVVTMGRYPHLRRFAAPTADDRDCVAAVIDQCEAQLLAPRYMTALSGGEKQRVVFARALAQDTPVLLLDEPCANLDVCYALLLLDIAAQKVKEEKRTVVAVMHDINLAARYCDQLIFMKDGRIQAAGATAKVLDEGILKDIFGVEAKLVVEPAIGAPQVVFLR